MVLPNIATKNVGDAEVDGGKNYRVRVVSGQNVYGAETPATAALTTNVMAQLAANVTLPAGLSTLVLDTVIVDLGGEYNAATGIYTADAAKTVTIVGAIGSDEAAVGLTWLYITPAATGVAVPARALSLIPTNTDVAYSERVVVAQNDVLDIRVTKSTTGSIVLADPTRTYLSIQG